MIVPDQIRDTLIKKLNFNAENIEKLKIYHELILKGNQKYNFISKSTEKDIWHRHILDSAQIVRFIDFSKRSNLVDLGSGAGFPGIVI